MRPRPVERHARDQLHLPGQLGVLQPQRALRVKAFDEVLDVRLRVLREHEAGDRMLEFAAVEHHRRVHGKVVVLPGMVDMKVGVDDVAHVADLEAVPGELVLHHVLMELEAAHAERLHDRVVAVAGIDHHGVAAARDEEAVDRDAPGAPAIPAEDEEARFELDIAVVEELDLERHGRVSISCRAVSALVVRALRRV